MANKFALYFEGRWLVFPWYIFPWYTYQRNQPLSPKNKFSYNDHRYEKRTLCKDIWLYSHFLHALDLNLRRVSCSFLLALRIYPVRFGHKTLELMPKLKSRGEGMPELPQEDTLDGPKIFNDMSWNDEMNWDHARLKPLVVYLRGNSSLQLPPEWKAVFPKHIWTCVWPGGDQVKPMQRFTPHTI